MGLTNTTTNLSYARNELIKVGVSFTFDKVADMIYYMLANDDVSTASTAAQTIAITDTDGGGYGLKISNTFTKIGVTAHKAMWSEVTYTPSATGTACPIAVVGKVTLNGNITANAASGWYPGMGWGVQGQMNVAAGATLDSAGYGDPSGVWAGVRGTLTDDGTNATYTKGVLCNFFGDIQMSQDASQTNFKVYGLFLYPMAMGGVTDVDALIMLDASTTHGAGGATIDAGIIIAAPTTVGIDIEPSSGTTTTGIDIGTVTTGINLTGTQTTGIIIGSSVTTGITSAASVDVTITAPGASIEAIDGAITQDGTANLTGTSLKAVKGQATWTATGGYTGNSYGGWFGITLDAASGMERGGILAGMYAEAATARTENCQPSAVGYFQSVVSGAGIMANMPILVLTSTGGSEDDKSMYAIEFGHEPASTTVGAGSGYMYYNETIKVKANGSDRFIPLSTAEGTYTTAYPIATTSTIVQTCTTAGISSSASTLHASTGRIGKFVGSVANANQGDGYGVFEVQANFSGTVPTGSVANASSFWINLSGSTVTAGTILCVQNNGIWAPGGLTLSTTTMVIGMRMHCEISGGTQPNEIFCFSTNIVANHITSLWQINVIEDINTTSTKSGDSVAVPWLKTSAGTQYYVNAYTT